MWGIEFFDEAAKNRRSVKTPSPKSNGATSESKQVQKETSDRDESQATGIQDSAPQSQPAPDSSPIGSDQASIDQSPQSNEPAAIPEQAEDCLEMPSDETSEEKIGDHVTVNAAEHVGTSEGERKRHHVTPNLRDESIDEDYVIIHHKDKGDLPKPGILILFLNNWQGCFLVMLLALLFLSPLCLWLFLVVGVFPDFLLCFLLLQVWRRRLVLRHKLTMHTAFAREDNAAPAAITSLLVSK